MEIEPVLRLLAVGASLGGDGDAERGAMLDLFQVC